MHFNYDIIFVVVQCLVGVQARYPTTGVFTGINANTGERPARRDITELRNDVPAFSLYIQALQAMMDTPENNLTSHFQISGIHGRPFYAWDNVAQTQGALDWGYCTHDNVLFMSWHRPYLALYEQILAQHVQVIAKRYNSQTYQTAADLFRIPYWDWAVPPYQMPSWFSTASIVITTPTGNQSVPNPLASYRFRGQPYPSSVFPSSDELVQYSTTVRRPSNGQSDPDLVNALLSSQVSSQVQLLYAVFARSTTWNQMSSESSIGASFEVSHAWVHFAAGGHMGQVPYSAFDTLFWLHHTGVDRLGAMWQAIYPSSTMTQTQIGAGTFTLLSGQTVNAQTPLLPFHQSNGQPWTTETARYTRTFGYSYSDVRDWSLSATDLRSSVIARVNQLYSGRSTSAKRRAREVRKDPTKPEREWTIAISAPKRALGSESYAVLLFLTSKPADPFAWVPESIGSMFVLGQPLSVIADASMNSLLVKTEIIITNFLQDRGVDTRDVIQTKKFLDTNLIWGVQKADGTIVDNKLFKGLKLLVEDDIVKLPQKITELPQYLKKTEHPDVTPVNPLNPAT